MVDYLNFYKQKQLLLQKFEEFRSDAQETEKDRNYYAVDIQRVLRGSIQRDRLTKKHYAANEIQRVIRGIMGRQRALDHLQQKLENRQLSLFHYFCVQLQRSFRGYYSRKYKHNMAKRKEDVNRLDATNKAILASMAEYAKTQLLRESDEAEARRESEFRSYAEGLHHLVSTKHINGVYNPREMFMQAPTMNSIKVEDHIRGVVKDLLRTRGINRTGLVKSIGGTRKIPYKGLKYRLSLQASVPYDTIEKEKLRQHHLHKILTREKGDFFAGGRTKVIDKSAAPLHALNEPYLDTWANPLLVKGVPENQKQLLESSRAQKPLFKKTFEKPFVSGVGGNRSAVLPNDLFDVIAEAEESGGAIHRNLGASTRFGLPASADGRYGGSTTIPMAPLRASATIKSVRPRNKIYTVKFSSSYEIPAVSQSTVLKSDSSSVLEVDKQDIENYSDMSQSQIAGDSSDEEQ